VHLAVPLPVMPLDAAEIDETITSANKAAGANSHRRFKFNLPIVPLGTDSGWTKLHLSQ